jgi:hypothetical protein
MPIHTKTGYFYGSCSLLNLFEGLYFIVSMKNIFLFLVLLTTTNFCRAGNSSYPVADSMPHTNKIASRNEKLYCSDFAKTRYKLAISGNKIKITRLYKEYVDSYSGVIKSGKIYSNDPNEKNLKMVWGKYYKLQGKNFGVLNPENGDYEWFVECKQ